MIRSIGVSVLALLFVPAVAQTLPTVPDPATCVVAPRPTAFFVPLTERLADAGATPASVATPQPIPASAAASGATRSEVVDLLLQAIACTNAQDFPRFFALFTDEAARDAVLTGWEAGLRAVQGAGAGSPATERGNAVLDAILAVGPPLPEALRAALVDVRDVRETDDGRVTAVVVRSLSGGGQVESVVEFGRVDGRLRIARETVLRVVLPTPAP
jgi:hypothetical protein